MSTQIEQAFEKAKQQQATNAGTNAGTNAPTSKVVQVNTGNALEIGEAVLRTIGHPVHHTALHAKAQEMGLNPSQLDIATRIWTDCGKNQNSKFLFHGKSIYGLREWPNYQKGCDITAYTPTRAKSTNTGALTLEQLETKVNRLRTELAAAEKALADRRANPDQEPQVSGSSPSLPKLPSRDQQEAAKDAAILASLPPARSQATKLPSAPAPTPPAAGGHSDPNKDQAKKMSK